jgi:uncharacterized membrane protein YvbJ
MVERALFIGYLGKHEILADSFAELKSRAASICNRPKHRSEHDVLVVRVANGEKLPVGMLVERTNTITRDGKFIPGKFF